MTDPATDRARCAYLGWVPGIPGAQSRLGAALDAHRKALIEEVAAWLRENDAEIVWCGFTHDAANELLERESTRGQA